MKRLKFFSHLVPLILSGEKNSTWRIQDDKDLSVGDRVEFVNTQTGEVFGQANITQVEIKKLGQLTPADFQGHEKFKDEAEMYATYREYYGPEVGPDTEIKMIDFQLE